jgi:hypothetical protein
MATTALPPTSQPLFRSQVPAPAPPPEGWGAWAGRVAVNTLFFIPRRTSEEATQGFANRVNDLLGQPELANRIRDLVVNSLLRHTPDLYHQLLRGMRAFLRTSSRVDLEPILPLLEALRRRDIHDLVPDLLDDAVQVMLTLKTTLRDQVQEVGSTLTVSDEAKQHLRAAEKILAEMISHHEGGLLQIMNALIQGITGEDGPVMMMRRQITDPEHGALAEGLRLVRQQLNAKAAPELREAKAVLEAYRTAVNRHAPAQEIAALPLQAKLTALVAKRNIIPQITPEEWPQIQAAAPENLEQLTGIVTRAFEAQRGMLEEMIDMIVEGIGRGVEQLVPMPGRMVQGMFSSASAPAAAAPAPASDAAPVSASVINIGSILSRGQALFSALVNSPMDAAARAAGLGLGTLLSWVLEKVKKRIERSGEHRSLLPTINPLIQRLQNPHIQNSWEQFQDVLNDTLEFMSDQQIYLQGLRLPFGSVRNRTSAIPGFLNNIHAHDRALQSTSARALGPITPEMIHRQAEHLKMRCSSYGPAQIVIEKFCGMNVSPAFYADIYRPSSDPLQTDLTPIFRQRLFDQIDKSDAWGITKWVAKRAYDALHAISTFYAHSMMDNILKKTLDWMKPDLPGQASKDEVLINIARNWLAVVSKAYNDVAVSPHGEDIDDMMVTALEDPKRNAGLNPQQLYAATAATALETFGPSITWTESISQFFQVDIPADSPFYFLNPVVKVVTTIASYCLQGIVFIPQWICNQVLKIGAKLAFSNTPLLHDYSKKMIESLRRNTPASYALHQMIYQKMQKVLLALQQSLNEEAGSSAVSRNSNIKTEQIAGLVKYSLEVLTKGQYGTQDALFNYLNRRDPLRHRGEHELENTFLPEIMPTAIRVISVALETMTGEKEMQEMLYQGLEMGNHFFDNAKPVSEADFAAVEKGIRDLTDQILETAILHTLEEKFDFANEKQKRDIAQFFTTLKNQAQGLKAAITQKAEEIASGAPDLRGAICSMIETSAKFNKERVDALSCAAGNGSFHTETKHKLNDLSRELSTKCATLSTRLNTLKALSDEIIFSENMLTHFLKSAKIHRNIVSHLASPRLSSREIGLCQREIGHLRTELYALRQKQCPPGIEATISREIEELSAALSGVQPFYQAEEILAGALPLFDTLKREKLATLGIPPSAFLVAQEKRILDLLGTLPFADQKASLNQAVRSLIHSVSPEGIRAASEQFRVVQGRISTRNTAEKNTRLEILQRVRRSLEGHIDASVRGYARNYAEKQTAIGQHTAEATREVQEVDAWAQSQNDLPIWNIFAFDMQWVTENIKNIAVDRAKEKVQLLFNALYHKHNYVGFVNQAALLPFLRQFGKHHLAS